MLQKVLKFTNLYCGNARKKIKLFCSSCAKNFAKNPPKHEIFAFHFRGLDLTTRTSPRSTSVQGRIEKYRKGEEAGMVNRQFWKGGGGKPAVLEMGLGVNWQV